ncbi:gibberellin-regulated protein 5-like [Papaver somniferum]|uniref:gibberellin-regulated protein 5-like n=1 Tax=Papaver somniferum TaxID=3469 RepID=UPI000E6FEA63|nr:gibberellin-regulated protein 5-like [Papaver somniferum]
MATRMVKFVGLLLLSLFAISMIESAQVSAGTTPYYGSGSVSPNQCNARCSTRCSKTKHHFPFCMESCMPCCRNCGCVPPGFSGNKPMCPCYNSMKTHRGTPKCP